MIDFEIPNDNGIVDVDPTKIGGEIEPPPPGIYLAIPSFPDNKKPEDLIKVEKTDQDVMYVSTILNFTLIDSHSDLDESLFKNKKVFNTWMSTRKFGQSSTSRITDFLIAAGIPDDELSLLTQPGGLKKTCELLMQVVADQTPVALKVDYDWQGESTIMKDKEGKPMFIQRGKENGMEKVPQGTKNLPVNADGTVQTALPYTHVWPSGETEKVILNARPTVKVFFRPEK